MSGTDKDQPWRLGGQRHKYYTSEINHAKFTRYIRKMARAKAKNAIRHEREPLPQYIIESQYWD